MPYEALCVNNKHVRSRMPHDGSSLSNTARIQNHPSVSFVSAPPRGLKDTFPSKAIILTQLDSRRIGRQQVCIELFLLIYRLFVCQALESPVAAVVTNKGIHSRNRKRRRVLGMVNVRSNVVVERYLFPRCNCQSKVPKCPSHKVP